MALYNKPKQRLPSSGKNKSWKIENMKYYCSQADEQYEENYQRMFLNYMFHNNQVEYFQEEFQKYCDPMGLDVGQGKDYVQAFNKTPNKINVLQGEESEAPWNYHVYAINENEVNEVIRQKTRDFREYVNFFFEKEATILAEKRKAEVLAQSEGKDEKQIQKELEAVMAEFEQEEAQLLDPKQINAKYLNYKTAREKLMQTLVDIAKTELNLKHKKNEAFFDVNVAGVEAILVNVINNRLNVEVLNPLGIAYHKSPEVEFIEHGDWVVYKREMTVGDVLDQYGKYLKESEIKTLESYIGHVFGTDAKMYSKTGFSPSSWENRQNRFTGVIHGTTNVLHPGKYGQSFSNEDYVEVYTAYWVSQEKVGFLIYIDEYGEEQTDKIDESFPIPEDAEKFSYKDEDGIRRTKYTWNLEDITFTLEWEWQPKIWEGTKIRDNIFINIKPYRYVFQSNENPYDIKLPIHGATFNNKNAPITSTMDRMLPWAKLYMFTMAKMLKLIGNDQGVINLLNMVLIDPDIGVDMTLQYARDMNFLPYNPLANVERAGGYLQNMKPADRLDLSNTQQITYYADLLRFIEENIGDAAGIPAEREGRTSRGSNVTDNQQDIMQSTRITAPVFAKHDLVWESILNSVTRVQQLLYSDPKAQKKLRRILSDEELAILEIDGIELIDAEFGLKITNNRKAHEALQLTKSHLQALIQNDKIQLSTFLDMLTNEDLVTMKQEIKEMEENIRTREEEMRQYEAEAQERALQIEIEHREDIQAHEIEKEHIKSETAIEVAQINAVSKQNQEIDQSKVENERTKIEAQKEIEKEKLAQKEREVELRARTEEKKIKAQANKPAK